MLSLSRCVCLARQQKADHVRVESLLNRGEAHYIAPVAVELPKTDSHHAEHRHSRRSSRGSTAGSTTSTSILRHLLFPGASGPLSVSGSVASNNSHSMPRMHNIRDCSALLWCARVRRQSKTVHGGNFNGRV